MAFKTESSKAAEMFSLPIGHESRDKLAKRNIICGESACGVPVQIIEVILHGEREKRHAVVEERSECNGFIVPVVDNQPEVAEVSVRITDEGVKDNHIAEWLIKCFAHHF